MLNWNSKLPSILKNAWYGTAPLPYLIVLLMNVYFRRHHCLPRGEEGSGTKDVHKCQFVVWWRGTIPVVEEEPADVFPRQTSYPNQRLLTALWWAREAYTGQRRSSPSPQSRSWLPWCWASQATGGVLWSFQCWGTLWVQGTECSFYVASTPHHTQSQTHHGCAGLLFSLD